MSRRMDAGPLLVLAGAALLFISLFVAWYEPGLEAWDVFEVLDLLLAAAAVAAVLASLGLLADFPSAPDAGVLPWISAAAFVVVVATLLDRPPVVGDGEPDVGLWLALAGSALMAAGTLLGLARVSVSLAVATRDRRQPTGGADARPAETGPAATSSGSAGATPDAPLFGATAPKPEPEPKPDPAARPDPDPTEPMPPADEPPRT